MKFRIVLEFDAETNSYSAVCPELPGCASAGDTEEEARANIEEAIRLYLAPTELSLPESAKLGEATLPNQNENALSSLMSGMNAS